MINEFPVCLINQFTYFYVIIIITKQVREQKIMLTMTIASLTFKIE